MVKNKEQKMTRRTMSLEEYKAQVRRQEMFNNVIDTIILDPRLGKDGEFPLPAAATKGSAGLDMRAMIDAPIVIQPDERVMISTGLAINIGDRKMAAILIPRSGLGCKHGVILGNTCGLIDSDYQGELKVCLWNTSKVPFELEVGERICQMMFIPIVPTVLNPVESFSNTTERGAGGFGSTGVK